MKASMLREMRWLACDEDDDATERAFRKTYKCGVPVYGPTTKRSYIAINFECFSKYVGVIWVMYMIAL